MPCEQMHWSKDSLFVMPIHKRVMSLVCFEKIKQAHHFSNNETYNPNLHPVPNLNKIYKVNCYLQRKFPRCYTPEHDISIDESFIKADWVGYSIFH